MNKEHKKTLIEKFEAMGHTDPTSAVESYSAKMDEMNPIISDIDRFTDPKKVEAIKKEMKKKKKKSNTATDKNSDRPIKTPSY